MRLILFPIVIVLAINGVYLTLDVDCFANCFKSGVVDPICTKFEGKNMTAMNEQFITCLRDCGSNIEEIHKGKCPGDTKFDDMIEKLQKASDEHIQKETQNKTEEQLQKLSEEKKKQRKEKKPIEKKQETCGTRSEDKLETEEDEILKDEL